MKKAIIYFEGKVVIEVLFDTFFEYGGVHYFLIKEDTVAKFPSNYGFIFSDIILSPKYTPAP